MKITDYVNKYPKLGTESICAYSRRISEIAFIDGVSILPSSIRQNFYRNKTKWQATQRKIGRNGEVISSVEKNISEIIPFPENFEIKRISTNLNTHQQWVIAEPDKNREISIDEIKQCLNELDFDKINKVYSKPINVNSDNILRIIITDIHVGMETNEDGNGLYGEIWNENVLSDRVDVILKKVSSFVKFKKYKEIHLINLGDFMDGWDGQTVRKGHNLPQNMDNKKAFKVGLNFFVDLYSRLSAFNIKIVIHSITNSNHSNDFDYIVNYSAKEILKAKYLNIEYNIYQRFIGHYIAGKHCFIISHGKDAKNLKFGFKPILDSKQKDKIKEYIKHHNLENYYCTFEKGDTHLQLIDSMSMDGCDYNNYLAFSPASEWVQTNFSKGRSGFNIMDVNLKENEKGLTTFYFDWQRPKNYDYGH
jgi:hypothetical protein